MDSHDKKKRSISYSCVVIKIDSDRGEKRIKGLS